MGILAAHRPFVYCCFFSPWRICSQRGLSCTALLSSGHNRWSKIKHDKGKNDAAKSKARSLLARDVILASKLGGPDPAFNPRLVIAMANAKKGALSQASIESAVARGQGKSTSGAALESLTIEAMLPFSVGAVIECQTDGKLRTLQDIRAMILRRGGSITPTTFLFERKGRVVFEKRHGMSTDEVLDQAIEAGAMDVDMDQDGRLVVETEPSEISVVAQRLRKSLGVEVESSDIIHDPKDDTMVSLKEENMAVIEDLIAQIEEEPSVQDVYINAA
ncbi:hypothetical protein GJ744_007209 [Endocarpon pusillum]|uniref:Transcriptional regulatory protein n=1 Tax=Endocarpon pusillum TaxID=364733 RepID=A0A8H7DWM9_9EURO|nr:hypothetical protein GJ744_007209 [Endocarpon pusillum]